MKQISSKMVRGVAINDADYQVSNNKVGIICPYYRFWFDMINRCYSGKQNTYSDVSVCDDWLIFSSFKDWMIDKDYSGKHLDKDLLVYGNKIYSPETCMFIPEYINYIFKYRKSSYLMGARPSPGCSNWTASMVREGERIYLGSFGSELDANLAYVSCAIERINSIGIDSTDDDLSQALFARADLLQSMVDERKVIYHL